MQMFCHGEDVATETPSNPPTRQPGWPVAWQRTGLVRVARAERRVYLRSKFATGTGGRWALVHLPLIRER